MRVSKSSTIQVKRNTYSVHSRLIGHQVDVVIDADSLVVQHGDTKVQTMPRLIGSGKHAIHYRHVIDSLFRKPGAFANYKYREDMFPTSHFRIAFDALCDQHTESVATREYLKILQLAAKESQDAVQDALRVAITSGSPISSDAVKKAVAEHQQLPAATDITIEPPDLQEFDLLLKHSLLPSHHAQTDKEVQHEHQHEEISSEEKSSDETTDAFQEHNAAEINEVESDSANNANDDSANDQHQTNDDGVDRAIPRSANADVPRTLRELGGKGDARIAEPHRIPERTDEPRMPGSARKSDRTADATIATPDDKNLGELRLEATSAASDSAVGESSRRNVPRPPGKSPAVREARFGKESLSFCVGRTVGLARPIGVVHNVQFVSAAVAGCQT